MKKLVPIFKKELAFYLNNPIGYIVAVLFAVFANFLFVKDLFLRGTSTLRPFFELAPWLLLIFVPAVAMHLFSQERRTNTIEVLLTLPITELQVVVAKAAALVSFSAIALLLTLSLPLGLGFLGEVYIPHVIVSYAGVVFLIALFAAVSLFLSSLTKNQVVAFLSAILALFVLLVLGGDFLASVVPRALHQHIVLFSPLTHLASFLRGVVDMRAVFYFVSTTVMFLFFTIITVERRA